MQAYINGCLHIDVYAFKEALKVSVSICLHLHIDAFNFPNIIGLRNRRAEFP